MLLGVLTVSDRCSQGLMTDTAGPAVAALLGRQWPQAEIWTGLVPDDEDSIAATLEKLSLQGAALVLTVGGTGLGPRDRTPEATRRVIGREAPGLAEAMRSLCAATYPFAWLSRAVAGLRGSTLIVNLPGSKRGAEESLAAILALLQHAIEVAAGGQSHP
ncbi:MAG TPA: MogA/MoaB family molybdenum cofactor biosynthesis protein [Terracidiphilus sp.]|jgi:molybdenum cofactor synthesis domain-containing protein|nr:MogA/MoaB family molybdenum cofactor biosynthesis protein [Terracidiphilus sp.]